MKKEDKQYNAANSLLNPLPTKQSANSSDNRALYILISIFSILLLVVLGFSLLSPILKDFFLITT